MGKTRERIDVQWRDMGDGYFAGVGGYMFPLAYVALPEGHPDTGRSYDEVCNESTEWGPEVNGGLTYSDGNVFGWDYGHYQNDYDTEGDIERAVAFFRARAGHATPA